LRKVLVTGGASFIGSYLVDALLTGEINVSVFDNLSSGTLQTPFRNRRLLIFSTKQQPKPKLDLTHRYSTILRRNSKP